MRPEHYTPCDALKPFIKTFLVITTDGAAVNRVLPAPALVMAFCYKGSITFRDEAGSRPLAPAVISGVRKTARFICYAPGTANVLVIFREGGAAAFLREPLHELFDQSLAMDDLIPHRELSLVEEQLGAAHTDAQRIHLLEQFLLSRLHTTAPDPLVKEAIHTIKAEKGNVNIRQLLSSLPISRDPFEKRFRRATGTTPKQFSSIIRLRTLISHYSDAISLTSAAHTAGYFDQAHFIKDFRSFTGQAPRSFFATKDWW